MSSLKGSISRLSKQKVITGIAVDVLQNLCSVKLSGRGVTLHGLKFIGTAPAVGETVRVDYGSGTPVVHATADNLQVKLDELRTEIYAQNESTNTVPSAPPEEVVSNTDSVRRFTGNTAAPTTIDDEDAGYEVSDIWIDETSDEAYILLDAASGAADWLNIGSSGVPEAPIDGLLYGRKDASWELVPDAVLSLNGLIGAVTLSEGTNITLTPTGNDIEISSAGGGGTALQLVMEPGVTHPPVPVETPDGTDWVYFEV